MRCVGGPRKQGFLLIRQVRQSCGKSGHSGDCLFSAIPDFVFLDATSDCVSGDISRLADCLQTRNGRCFPTGGQKSYEKLDQWEGRIHAFRGGHACKPFELCVLTTDAKTSLLEIPERGGDGIVTIPPSMNRASVTFGNLQNAGRGSLCTNSENFPTTRGANA